MGLDVLSVYLQCCNIHQSSPSTRVELSLNYANYISSELSMFPLIALICITALSSQAPQVSRLQPSGQGLYAMSSELCPLSSVLCYRLPPAVLQPAGDPLAERD